MAKKTVLKDSEPAAAEPVLEREPAPADAIPPAAEPVLEPEPTPTEPVPEPAVAPAAGLPPHRWGV